MKHIRFWHKHAFFKHKIGFDHAIELTLNVDTDNDNVDRILLFQNITRYHFHVKILIVYV